MFIALPLVYFFLKRIARGDGFECLMGKPSGKPPEATRKGCGTGGEGNILRHREFWMLVSIFIVLSFVLNGMLAHLVPMLSDRGMDTGTAAAVAATEGITVFCQPYRHRLPDRSHSFAPYVAMVFFSLSAVGIAIFALGAVDTMAFVGAICVGLSLGAEVDLLAYLTGRYFGLKSFGATYRLPVLCRIGRHGSLGPLAFGIGYDTTGSYVGILTICVGINILAVILSAFLGKYPDWEKPARVSDERIIIQCSDQIYSQRAGYRVLPRSGGMVQAGTRTWMLRLLNPIYSKWIGVLSR